MSSESPAGGGTWTPPFVQPLLRALDRMQQRHAVSPEAQTNRAQSILTDRLGAAPFPSEATFSHGVLGIAADHTILMDGFALMLPIRDGIAVAIRESNGSTSRLVFDGDDQIWEFDIHSETTAAIGGDKPWWVTAVELVVKSASDSDHQVDVAVVSTVLPACEQSYSAALAMAALRTSQAVFPSERDEKKTFTDLTAFIEQAIGLPQSPAYTIATDVASVGQFILVDAGTGRRLPFPTPVSDPVGWGLIDTGDRIDPTQLLGDGKKEVAAIVERLGKKQFPGLGSLRNLEHKDLEVAEKAVGRHQRRILRHLVRENQRVQRMVTAARHGDWQLFGALMAMAHASFSNEMSGTPEATDYVVELVEEQTVSGMYGGRALGFSGVAVVLGQPFVVPQFLDATKVALDERFGIAPNTVLL